MRPKPASEAIHEVAVVVRRGPTVLLRQCAAGERWAGLWDFLRFPLEKKRGQSAIEAVAEQVRSDCGLAIGAAEHIATLKHGVTRFRITLDCYLAAARGRLSKPAREVWRWVPIEEIDAYPLSVTGRKLARLVHKIGSRASSE